MAMSKVEPQAFVATGRPHQGLHIGDAGTSAQPGLLLDSFAKLHQLAHQHFRALELHWRRRRIQSGELRAGRNAQTGVHGRQHDAVFRIQHGNAELRRLSEMPVIATFDEHRQVITQLADRRE
ncbi:hypothetical protein D3C78_1538660 [compost metagenome]